MAVLFVTNANAVGFGDIQQSNNPVGSPWGQITLVSGEHAGKTDSEPAYVHEPGTPAKIKKQPVKRPDHNKSKPVAEAKSLASSRSSKDGKSSSESGKEQATKRFGKLSLWLSLTLTPPTGDGVKPIPPKTANDASLEESISKQKALDDLNARIAEMEKMLKAQKDQLDASAGVTSNGQTALQAKNALIIAVANMFGFGNDRPKVEMDALPVRSAMHEGNQPDSLFSFRWPYPLIGLGALLLFLMGLVWYQRYKAASSGMPVTSPASNGSDDSSASADSSNVDKSSASLGAHAMKVPSRTERDTRSILPPEYEMLEEAEINLRFGHDRLAEEVLREAIKINPKNPQAYLMLMSIYATREDAAALLAVGQRLKSLGDESAWKKASEIGRKLDPDNPIYR